MNILEKIVTAKSEEVAKRKALYPEKLLEQSIYFEGKPISMSQYLTRKDKNGIIAEFKRQSPSKGIINNYAAVERTTIGYMQAGASGLSMLTDKEFFGGTSDDLMEARHYNFCPILRKDFIIDEYQILEAKSIGADCILLIAAILKPEEVKQLSSFAQRLGLEVLLEVHDLDELQQHLCDTLNIVGVNNRDLKVFKTNIQTSQKLAEHIPDQFVKISESGIHDPETILTLQKSGFQGFLIGEQFMKHDRPERACQEFIEALEKLKVAAA